MEEAKHYKNKNVIFTVDNSKNVSIHTKDMSFKMSENATYKDIPYKYCLVVSGKEQEHTLYVDNVVTKDQK